ncbi:MAG: hypothetical protein BAJALOKI1v1_30032 [Promethearchaeota archaeon]|nr:MAG: hypothetical protein BAJALOKI1v1_30032 [Candidatus Lokiarchaeota archaeon]
MDEIVGRVYEEVSELLFEISKHFYRNKPNKLLIAHEIADVWLAIENLVEKLGIQKEVQLAKKELDEYEANKELAKDIKSK